MNQSIRCIILAVLACLVSTGSQGARFPDRPNIVFILVDDMGIGDVSIYNPESKISTPNIDRLAEQGMRFTDAHAAGAICVPSRYGLMTGEYACRTWDQHPPRGNSLKDPDKATIASVLKSAGYDTAMVGKWHLGIQYNKQDLTDLKVKYGPVEFGFDYFFGMNQSLDTQPYYYVENDRMVAAPTGHIEGQEGDPAKVSHPSIQGPMWRTGSIAPGFDHAENLPLFTEKAKAYLQSRAVDGNPFFLYLAYAAPHAPWLPDPEFQGKSGAGDYGDFTMQVDHCIGQVLDALDRKGLSENTVVIFSSDNGPLWFPEDVEMYDHNSSLVYRDMKLAYYEGGHREPFIVRWPGVVKAGSTTDQMVNFTDMMATFADIAGTELPDDAGLDSFSILPVLNGTARGPVRTDNIHEQFGRQTSLAYRHGDWKLLLPKGVYEIVNKTIHPDKITDIVQFELFNLKSDPGESNNLALKNPEKTEALFALLEENIKRGRSR